MDMDHHTNVPVTENHNPIIRPSVMNPCVAKPSALCVIRHTITARAMAVRVIYRTVISHGAENMESCVVRTVLMMWNEIRVVSGLCVVVDGRSAWGVVWQVTDILIIVARVPIFISGDTLNSGGCCTS